MRWIMVIIPLIAVLFGACVPQSKYEWGSYEQALYAYYKDPEQIEVLMTALDRAIVNGEQAKRVPPGIFAEYGFLLMNSNRGDEAIRYFKKEKTVWPESSVLMDKMIAAVKQNMERIEKSDKSEKIEKAVQQ